MFLTSPVAQLVVTSDGLVALLNQQAEAMFGVSSRDVGRPFRDLDVSYRPVELRKYIDQAQVERRPLHLTDVEHRQRSGETTYLSVQINPLVGTDASLLGVAVVFQDVTAARQLREDLERANRDLEAAYEELQSTNEELETTNEELQSTNDELQSMNDQLNASSSELDDANSFLDAVLTGLRSGVAVVDRDLRVRAWNRRAENLWGLRTGEVVGEHLLTLDIGLPIESVRPLLRQALSGDADIAEVQLAAVNRRGRHITVLVTCSPLVGQGPEVTGAIIVMDSDESPPPATDLSVG